MYHQTLFDELWKHYHELLAHFNLGVAAADATTTPNGRAIQGLDWVSLNKTKDVDIGA